MSDLYDLYEECAEYCAIRDGIIGSRFMQMASGISRDTALKMLEYWRISRSDDDDAFVRVVRHGDQPWQSVSLTPTTEVRVAGESERVADESERVAIADDDHIPF